MMLSQTGKIITFYSYKGGTGRTMALSNIAWILASNGNNVLLIDWDLEAPGLHRYLRPFLVDPELSSTPGLIDYVWDAARVNMTPEEGKALSKRIVFPSLDDYAVGLDWKFSGGGSIAFIPAGRQDENYAQRVNTFDWDNFYERLGGGNLLNAEREALRKNYQYILIDSRTGVSDTSSICTVHMPDALAVFFTLNWQSINGAAAVATSVRAQRGEAFPIYPIPTRIENAETERRDISIAYARRVFGPFLVNLQPNDTTMDAAQQSSYWKDVQTPYVTYYAFEEVPAAFKDEPGSHEGVLASNERIASWLTGGRVSSLKPEPESRRKAVIEKYMLSEDRSKVDLSLRDPSPSAIRALVGSLWSRLVQYRWQLGTFTAAAAAVAFALKWQSNAAGSLAQYHLVSSTLSMVNSQIESVRISLEKAGSMPSNADLNETSARLRSIEQYVDTVQRTASQVAPAGTKAPIAAEPMPAAQQPQ